MSIIHSFKSFLIVTESSKQIISNRRECITSGGPSPNKKCIFPFKFEVYIESNDTIKDTHDACIQDEEGFWCSTKVDEDGYHIAGSKNWGTCNSDCPMTPTRQGIMN